MIVSHIASYLRHKIFQKEHLAIQPSVFPKVNVANFCETLQNIYTEAITPPPPLKKKNKEKKPTKKLKKTHTKNNNKPKTKIKQNPTTTVCNTELNFFI